jgi:hypothetical protein
MNKNEILIELSESDKTKFGKEDFDAQSVPQKVFSAIWALESEVNNGGFSQYFLNSSCETAGFVAEALDTIGAPRTAEICRRAIGRAFPEGLPSNPEAISLGASDFSDETEEKLDALDQEFYQYPHDLTGLLFAYVSKHPDEFGKLPEPDDRNPTTHSNCEEIGIVRKNRSAAARAIRACQAPFPLTHCIHDP